MISSTSKRTTSFSATPLTVEEALKLKEARCILSEGPCQG
jgi:hypothetical protein